MIKKGVKDFSVFVCAGFGRIIIVLDFAVLVHDKKPKSIIY